MSINNCNLFWLSASILMLISCIGCQQQAVPNPIMAESNRITDVSDVIKSSREAYGKCLTYRDTSKFERTSPYPIGDPPDSGRYETLFVRPNHLRLDTHYQLYSQKVEHNVFWSIDGVANHYVSHHDAYSEVPLHRGLNMVSSGTGNTSWEIPRLLLGDKLPGPDVFDKITKLSDPPTELIEGVACYVLSSTDQSDDSVRVVWVGRDDYLIRKIELRSPMGSAISVVEPVINQTIETTAFNFIPPSTAIRRGGN